MNIDGKTKLLCVVGDPVEHTLSPLIHNTIIKENMQNLVYVAHHILPQNLVDLPKSIRTLGYLGMNVTVPHKVNIIPLIDEVDERARRIGAVNTVKNTNGVLKGYNTDADGFIMMLKNSQTIIKGKRITIIGAGGAAKAIAFALADEGAAAISIIDIAEEKADELAGAVCEYYPELAHKIYEVNDDCDILVNATSAGMSGSTLKTAFSDFDRLNGTKVVCDLVYNPRETFFLSEAKKRGHKTMNGLGMLIYQAVQAFEIITDVNVSKDCVKKVFDNLYFDKSIVLTGFMGTGKTAVGRTIAAKMAVDFIDADLEIEKRANMSIPEIFEKYQEEGFREIESETIKELSQKRGVVIALGGGAVLRKENIECFKENGVVVRLDLSFDRIKKNVGNTETRPVISLKTDDEIKKIMNDREQFYRNCDIEINRGEMEIDETVELILKHYRKTV